MASQPMTPQAAAAAFLAVALAATHGQRDLVRASLIAVPEKARAER
jgi:hypothetical protein